MYEVEISLRVYKRDDNYTRSDILSVGNSDSCFLVSNLKETIDDCLSSIEYGVKKPYSEFKLENDKKLKEKEENNG